MQALSADDLLGLWETARRRTPLEQALAIWATFDPTQDVERLWSASVFERDRALFAVRRRTYGELAECFVRCPKCAAELEVEFRLPAEDDGALDAGPWRLTAGEWEVIHRAPSSLDVWNAMQDGGPGAMQTACVVEARHRGDRVSPGSVPPDVLDRVAAELEARAGVSSIRFRLECDSCGEAFSTPFDIGRFLWREIEVAARRLLVEVDTLARAYGWSEQDILRMSRERRSSYVQLVETT